LVWIATCDHSAKADIYGSTEYSFNISGLSPAEVENAVIAESENPAIGTVPPDAHPVLARWQHSPCFIVEGNEEEAQRVQSLLDLVRKRTRVHISGCEVDQTSAITFFFSGGPTTPEDKDRILRLFGSSASPSDFLAGRSVCLSNARSRQADRNGVQPDDPSLQIAHILINTSALDETGVGRCLFVSLLSSLGLPQPQGMSGGVIDMRSDQWENAVELNLLGVFVVYSLDDASVRGTRQEVASAILALLEKMHSESN
jgi:hypothetical protein